MSIPQRCEFSFTGFGHLGERGLGAAWQARSSPLQATWAHSSRDPPGLRFACPVRSLQAVGGAQGDPASPRLEERRTFAGAR